MHRAIDLLRRLWWRMTDTAIAVWDFLRDLPRRTKYALVGGAIVVLGVVVIGALLVNKGAEDEADGKIAAVVITNADLPANLWSGWRQSALDDRPSPAAEIPGSISKPADCAPGGPLQRSVQELALSGDRWAGMRFDSLTLGARAETMVAANDRDVPAAVDAWTAACGSTSVKAGERDVQVTVKQLPVNPKTYRLQVARVTAQTVTPNTANAEPESTTLTAVGRSKGHVIYTTLMFPGAVNNDAIATLDTLWRGQAAKVVGYQQAGQL